MTALLGESLKEALLITKKLYAEDGTEIPETKKRAGRPPKEGGARRHVMSVRITDGTKERLIEAASKTARALADEMEIRLAESFDRPDLLIAIRAIIREELARLEAKP